MRVLAFAMLAAGICATAIPAQAQTYGNTNYPVCLQVYGRFARIDCNFVSIDQCRLSAAGISAMCIANPYYASAHVPAPRARHRQYRNGN